MPKRLTTETFLKRVKAKHGEKYDYSKSIYVNGSSKIIITCPEHGEFEQNAKNHMNGAGCQICAGNMKDSVESFIEKARVIHGKKYDYSKVDYKKTYSKVTIICPIHGGFRQAPNSHLQARGCPKCGQEVITSKRRLKTIDVVQGFAKIHGDQYDYSQVEYVNSGTKVKIICPKHGAFWQMPSGHGQGHGCPKCGVESRTEKKRSDQDEVLSRFREVHGDKYDYSLVNYVNNRTKVKIICKIHGAFHQIPSDHLRGIGCSKCGVSRASQKKRNRASGVLKKFEKVHGKRYSYSLMEYQGVKRKITIVCPEHGVFRQTPGSHLRGSGCPVCGLESQIEKSKSDTAYIVDRFRQVHGDCYDYSKVKYKNYSTKVEIICKDHGQFLQPPNDHVNGAGCPTCGLESAIEKNRSDLSHVIDSFKKVHGNEYDYSKVRYINSLTKVEIICKDHGQFLQSPKVHLKGSGCPKCSSSHGEKQIMQLLSKYDIRYKNEARLFRNYRYDFWLPDFNLAIEYHGEQHFSVDGFYTRTEKQLQKRKEIDKRKKNHILKKGWHFLEIPHWDFEKIEKLVLEKLKELGFNK